MFDLREKDLVNGRTYFDRMGNLLYLFLAPWLAVFCITFISYNNKITGIVDQKVSLTSGGVIAALFLAICIYIYFDFVKKLKALLGKELKEKVKLYYSYNTSFYTRINLLAMSSTLMYVFFNISYDRATFYEVPYFIRFVLEIISIVKISETPNFKIVVCFMQAFSWHKFAI